MPTIFVAMSPSLQQWASDVGLTFHVYKLGICDSAATDAIEALNADRHAGRADWQLLMDKEVDDADADAAVERAGRKEQLIDPTYYPQLKRASGIFKVKAANVENHFLVREALEGQQVKSVKITPARIGTYLIRAATG
jgi:hypothetical protein